MPILLPDYFWMCPLCQTTLKAQSTTWQCQSGHSFDQARSGYVNLLPVQHKHSKHPGDTAQSLQARRLFLQAGHYAHLQQYMTTVLSKLSTLKPETSGVSQTKGSVKTLVDIGCGEGYYSAPMGGVNCQVVGVDIAKPAIELAAKQYKHVQYVVASGRLLPINAQQVDYCVSIFAPVPYSECARILVDGGYLWVASAAADHLSEFRAALFEQVRPHNPEKRSEPALAAFEMVDQFELRIPLQLDALALQQLMDMTPYAYKATLERKQALMALRQLDTHAVFHCVLYRKSAVGSNALGSMVSNVASSASTVLSSESAHE